MTFKIAFPSVARKATVPVATQSTEHPELAKPKTSDRSLVNKMRSVVNVKYL